MHAFHGQGKSSRCAERSEDFSFFFKLELTQTLTLIVSKPDLVELIFEKMLANKSKLSFDMLCRYCWSGQLLYGSSGKAGGRILGTTSSFHGFVSQTGVSRPTLKLYLDMSRSAN